MFVYKQFNKKYNPFVYVIFESHKRCLNIIKTKFV